MFFCVFLFLLLLVKYLFPIVNFFLFENKNTRQMVSQRMFQMQSMQFGIVTIFFRLHFVIALIEKKKIKFKLKKKKNAKKSHNKYKNTNLVLLY